MAAFVVVEKMLNVDSHAMIRCRDREEPAAIQLIAESVICCDVARSKPLSPLSLGVQMLAQMRHERRPAGYARVRAQVLNLIPHLAPTSTYLKMSPNRTYNLNCFECNQPASIAERYWMPCNTRVVIHRGCLMRRQMRDMDECTRCPRAQCNAIWPNPCFLICMEGTSELRELISEQTRQLQAAQQRQARRQGRSYAVRPALPAHEQLGFTVGEPLSDSEDVLRPEVVVAAGLLQSYYKNLKGVETSITEDMRTVLDVTMIVQLLEHFHDFTRNVNHTLPRILNKTAASNRAYWAIIRAEEKLERSISKLSAARIDLDMRQGNMDLHGQQRQWGTRAGPRNSEFGTSHGPQPRTGSAEYLPPQNIADSTLRTSEENIRSANIRFRNEEQSVRIDEDALKNRLRDFQHAIRDMALDRAVVVALLGRLGIPTDLEEHGYFWLEVAGEVTPPSPYET